MSLLPIAARPEKRFDAAKLRNQFPVLNDSRQGTPLVYLDTAATALRPRAVIDAVTAFCESHYATVHRGVYRLSQESTALYEAARERVRGFVNAASKDEIVFVRSTTEAINLVASCLSRSHFRSGDEILITALEHHSNIVPWQLVGDQIGTELRVVPVRDDGALDLESFHRMLGPRTKLVAVTHTSNAIGVMPPLAAIAAACRERDVPLLVDAAQAAPHHPIDVRAWQADFVAFSAHKLYGPSGIGVLYGRQEWLERMPPYQGGGQMIERVTFEKTRFAPPPLRFEAGTPNIEGAVGLAAAIGFIESIGLDSIGGHEKQLLDVLTERLHQIPGTRILGEAGPKSAVVSFVLEGIHAHDVGTVLDKAGVAVRVGHHCAQPLMERFGVSATVRASFGLYSLRSDIDALIDGLGRAREIFG